MTEESNSALRLGCDVQALELFDRTIAVRTIADRFRAKQPVGEAVFCCVDSISARAIIWRAVEHRCRFWIDGRMLGEVIRVLAVTDRASGNQYASTLFPQADAQPGQCTSRSTIYTAMVAAGLMIHQFSRWLCKLRLDADATLNLLAGEFVQSSPNINVDAVPASTK